MDDKRERVFYPHYGSIREVDDFVQLMEKKGNLRNVTLILSLVGFGYVTIIQDDESKALIYHGRQDLEKGRNAMDCMDPESGPFASMPAPGLYDVESEINGTMLSMACLAVIACGVHKIMEESDGDNPPPILAYIDAYLPERLLNTEKLKAQTFNPLMAEVVYQPAETQNLN